MGIGQGRGQVLLEGRPNLARPGKNLTTGDRVALEFVPGLYLL